MSFPLFEEPAAEADLSGLSAGEEAEPEGFDLFSLSEPEDELPQEEMHFPHPAGAVEEPASAVEEEMPSDIRDEATEEPLATEEPETAFAEEEAQPVFGEVAPEQPSLPEEERYPKVEEAAAENRHPLYDRLHLPDDSLASRLMSVRLDTLKGAFGFNERVQIVQELFHGSNEQYTEAIEKLDNLDSKEEARSLVSEYANRFSWSERSDLVMEFAKKVERRYA